MAIDLLLSIVSSGLLFLILKKFPDWGIVTLHGILVNYFVAASLSLMLSNLSMEHATIHVQQALPYALAIGLLFIVVFMLTGKTAQYCGIAVSSIASKMSMVIPICIGFYLYGESIDAQRMLGMALALPAVVLSGLKPNQTQGKALAKNFLLLPFLLFVGAGLVDSAIKYAQFKLMDDTNSYLIIAMIFASAGSFGLLKLLWDTMNGGERISVTSIMGGALLGIINFFSLWFLVRCLDRPDVDSSHVFAIVNVGVVLMTFLIGLFVFKEIPTFKQRIGLVLAIIAIFVLTW